MAADRKRRLVVWFEKHLQNPPVRLALLGGLPLPLFALLETTGAAAASAAAPRSSTGWSVISSGSSPSTAATPTTSATSSATRVCG
jgi:hypothetical protein